jgi:hypothetical protein
MRSVLAFVAGGALLLSSTVASAEIARTSTPIGDREEIAGNPWVPWLVGIIAAVVIVLVVTDDDEPESP